MKSDIHPPFYKDATVTCTSCRAVFKIPGTVQKVHIEVCSNCHPVYTGKFRGVLTSGRVERFKKRIEFARSAPQKVEKKKKLSPEEKLERKLEIKRVEKKARKESKKKKSAKLTP